MKFHNQIFLAMASGALTGALVSPEFSIGGVTFSSLMSFLGGLFVSALQMIVLPLVASAVIASLARLGDGQTLGRLGGKTVAYYLGSSLLAILTGLALVNLLAPGIIDGEPAGDRLGLAEDTATVLDRVAGKAATDFLGIIEDMIPSNLMVAAAENQLIGIIVFSILFGFFLRRVEGPAGESLRNSIDGLYETMVAITIFIVRFAPLGVFALISVTVMNTGFSAIIPLAWFFLTVVLALSVHAGLVLPLAIRLLAKRSPMKHAGAMAPALATAFSTASSAATLPLTMECVEKRAGVSRRTTSFVLPLGATVNMDGTALYECVAVIFIAQAYGLDLSFAQQTLIVVAALLTSIGVASVPAASLVAITLILGMVGLPAEAIGLILVTDRLLDMCRTAVNIWGDSVGAVLIARSEGETDVLEGEQYRQPL